MRVLRTFQDGEQLAFDTGRFDNYRVSFYDASGNYIKSPADVEFFEFFLSLGNNRAVWDLVYNIASKITKTTALSELDIPTLNDTLDEEKIFSAHAAAMIAEERKKGTRLGKRVKLLGCYQALILDYSSVDAANWSRDKKWREIADECARHGF